MLLIDLILRAVHRPPPSNLIRLLVFLSCEHSLNLIFLETIKRIQGYDLGTNDGIEFMRDAALSSVDLGSSSRGYWAWARTEHSGSSLDGGEGRRSTHPRSVVWPCVEGSWEWRDTSNADAVTLPVVTLIPTLAATRMSMMTGTITSQALHHRVHSEMFFIHIRLEYAQQLGFRCY